MIKLFIFSLAIAVFVDSAMKFAPENSWTYQLAPTAGLVTFSVVFLSIVVINGFMSLFR